jgi:uncharacterized integral membrane protein (TIGR00698 family)
MFQHKIMSGVKKVTIIKKYLPGIAVSFGIAAIAMWLGNLFPIVGGPVIGIIIGILLGNTLGKPAWAESGIKFTSKKILQWAIIVLGTGLSLTQVWKTGIESLSVMVFTLSFAFISAYAFGRLMHIPFRLTSLIGVGTAICGGSAIAAVSPIIEAEESEVAYSISTIFFYNILAVLLFPPLGHLLGFSDTAFGLWAGTAVNDTSSVVAAGYAFSDIAGKYATIVKLTRTTMIIPISLIYAAAMMIHKKRAFKNGSAVNYRFTKIFPWFVIGFLAASLMNTVGIFNQAAVEFLSITGKFMIIMALSAVGLSADIRKMMKTGLKPLFLGFIVWVVVASVSIAVQHFTGQI